MLTSTEPLKCQWWFFFTKIKMQIWWCNYKCCPQTYGQTHSINTGQTAKLHYHPKLFPAVHSSTQMPTNSEKDRKMNARQSSNLPFLVTHVEEDGWFMGGGQLCAEDFAPKWQSIVVGRVCTASRFHLFCQTSSTKNFLMAVAVFTGFCCLYSYYRMQQHSDKCYAGKDSTSSARSNSTSPIMELITGVGKNRRKIHIFNQANV